MKLVKMRFTCPKCGIFSRHVIQAFAAQAQSCYCPTCREIAPVASSETGEDKPSDNQKRSQSQEKRAAKRYGGHRQAASGAMDHAKGDICSPGEHRGECKFTRAKSYRLTLQDLLEIEKHSRGDEKPFLEIEFQGVTPHKRYVVIPDWVFQRLLGGAV